MRWFKHPSNLRTDEQVEHFLDLSRDRHAAYGFFLTMCEEIARAMDAQSPGPARTLPAASWRRACDVPANRWAAHCEHLTSSGLAQFEEIEGKLRVTIPKLLTWCDEYTSKVLRNSGVTPDTLLPEKESEREKENRSRKEQSESEISALANGLKMGRTHSQPLTRDDQNQLGSKVDQILLDPDLSRLVVKDGDVDVRLLARLINQRDRKSNPEPSPKFVAAVRSCVDFRIKAVG